MKSLIFALFCLSFAGLSASRAQSLLPPDWNPKQAADEVLARLIKVTAPGVKGAHDAEFVLVGGKAYLVALMNDLRPSENPEWPEVYVALSIVDLPTMTVEKIMPVARGEQVFENATLPVGACFVPRILVKDAGTLRVFFASEQPKQRQSQVWFTDFRLADQSFENRIHPVRIKTAAGTFDMQPRYFHEDAAAQGFSRPPVDYGLYLFDMGKRFDGKTYVVLNNYPGGQNALGVMNEALDTVEVLGHYNAPAEFKLTESAINRLPDGTWTAICRQEGGDKNYTFATSKDGRSWSPNVHRDFVPNGAASKPIFEKFGDVYYLGWQESTTVQGVGRSVFNVEVSRDGLTWQRKYRFETEKSFQYPSFHQGEGAIWVSVTQGDTDASRKERIMFGRLE